MEEDALRAELDQVTSELMAAQTEYASLGAKVPAWQHGSRRSRRLSKLLNLQRAPSRCPPRDTAPMLSSLS
jgi:hypothetical protein